jgi:hypothetical protein
MARNYLNPEALTQGDQVIVRRTSDPSGWPETVDDGELCNYVLSVVSGQGSAKVVCESSEEVRHLMQVMEEYAVPKQYRKVTYYAP